MNNQRITVSLPEHVYRFLLEKVGKRQVSKFVARAIEQQMLAQQTQGDPVEQLLALKKQLPTYSRQEILAAMRRGRM